MASLSCSLRKQLHIFCTHIEGSALRYVELKRFIKASKGAPEGGGDALLRYFLLESLHHVRRSTQRYFGQCPERKNET